MPHNEVTYPKEIENMIFRIEAHLQGVYPLSKRSIALLLLQSDEQIGKLVLENDSKNYIHIMDMINEFQQNFEGNTSYIIPKTVLEEARKISNSVMQVNQKENNGLLEVINRLTINPLTGYAILLFVLYIGFYKFVGVFGAGILVNLIEKDFYETYLTPLLNNFFNGFIQNRMISDLFVNDYGMLTLGLKYAIAIVLPVVGCFFFMFSIIEDSGYLPRISMLLDRTFKKIGLNGRAVIPMVLGFGCDTMATMVSRTLETNRERVIATFLLALAIPCSAQLGVILALLSGTSLALLFWVFFMVFVFLLVGYLTSKVVHGDRAAFYMELPPLRVPKIKNIFKKTYVRMYWYFKEVLPLFILASVLIWLGNITGIFAIIISAMKPLMGIMGLPDSIAQVFLYGFFRRDFGAAGLLDMQSEGLLNARQLVVTASTLTLFVPCIAQFSMMIKERGLKTAIIMAAIIFPFAFGAGILINQFLLLIGVVF